MIRTLELRRDLSLGSACQGVDPGEVVGALAHCAAVEGRLVVRGVGLWKRRTVKGGHRWGVTFWTHERGVFERVAMSLGAAIVVSATLSPPEGEIGAVEAIRPHGARKGYTALAESSGAAVGILESQGRVVHRVEHADWMRDVAGLHQTAGDVHVLGCLRGEKVPGRITIADWGVRLPPELHVSHVADAIAISAWAMGFRLTGER